MTKTYDQVTPPSELIAALLMRLALQMFLKAQRFFANTQNYGILSFKEQQWCVYVYTVCVILHLK